MNMLEVKNLKTGFDIDGKIYNAVDDVSFSVKPRQIVGIVGESGCGKSVMSLSIMNLLPKGIGQITGGEIIFDGKNIEGLADNQMNSIRGKDISMIFQEPMTSLNPVFTIGFLTSLNPVFTIGFQIEEILLNHQKITKSEARTKAIELLKKVGIPRAETVVDEFPHQLSGGMRQRVMIAIAIACRNDCHRHRLSTEAFDCRRTNDSS